MKMSSISFVSLSTNTVPRFEPSGASPSSKMTVVFPQLTPPSSELRTTNSLGPESDKLCFLASENANKFPFGATISKGMRYALIPRSPAFKKTL